MYWYIIHTYNKYKPSHLLSLYISFFKILRKIRVVCSLCNTPLNMPLQADRKLNPWLAKMGDGVSPIYSLFNREFKNDARCDRRNK